MQLQRLVEIDYSDRRPPLSASRVQGSTRLRREAKLSRTARCQDQSLTGLQRIGSVADRSSCQSCSTIARNAQGA